MKLFILCGIPFGITRLIVFSSFGASGFLALIIFGFVISGAIGGVILIWRLIVAIYYILPTVVRFVAAREVDLFIKIVYNENAGEYNKNISSANSINCSAIY